MKKLWPLRTFHGSFAVGRDLLSCSTEYTLPVCFGCALVLARRSLIMEADSGVGAGPAGGGSAFAGVISICFILFVRAIAASRREAKSQPSAAIAEELQMNEGRYLRRSTHPPRHWVTKHRRTPHRGNRGARRWLGRRSLRHLADQAGPVGPPRLRYRPRPAA